MSVVKPVRFSDSEFRRLNRALVGYFRRRNYRHESEDLAASTWVDIIRYYEGRCSLRSFAFLVARKKVAEDLRRSRRPSRRALIEPLRDAGDEKLGNTPTADGPSPDSILMLAAGSEALVRALESVWDSYREVVALWLEGFSAVEIAAELSVPYNTVRSRLHRGRTQALAALEQELGL
ncbi:RNA polymerase sigma factor [Enhygromyxa salina]|nr:sigma-70 family RNA polymerase sigma factor [Enhygromyxa salina]